MSHSVLVAPLGQQLVMLLRFALTCAQSGAAAHRLCDGVWHGCAACLNQPQLGHDRAKEAKYGENAERHRFRCNDDQPRGRSAANARRLGAEPNASAPLQRGHQLGRVDIHRRKRSSTSELANNRLAGPGREEEAQESGGGGNMHNAGERGFQIRTAEV